MIRKVREWLRRGDKLDRELSEEIQFHLDSRAQLNQQAGEAAEDAHHSARRAFGNVTHVYEDTRRMHISELAESIAQDVRYALRSFARTPAFTLAAIFAITLGIAACSAVFSVVDRILFRSLPYANEDRLVWVGVGAPIEPNEFMLGPDYLEWRQEQKVFDAFTSSSGVSDCDVTESSPMRLACGRVEASFLPTLGIAPALGRNFTDEEDRPNGPRAVLLSHGFWLTRYGGDRSIAGRTMRLDGQETAIVGVLPASFELPNMARPDLLLPERLDEAEQRKRQRFLLLTAFGRLKPGVTLEQARAGLQPLFERSLDFVPPQFRKEVRLKVSSLRERQTRDARTASWTLLAAVICVLLIACANVANLLLARAAARRREQSIRAALGAGKMRLIRQSITESMLLAVIGGALGIAGGFALLHWMIVGAPRGIPRLTDATLDWRVAAVSAGAAVLCGLIFGVGSALAKHRGDALTGSRLATAPHLRLRNWLVSAQIAVSVVLLTGAGLLLESLWKLQNVQLGLRPQNVMSARISLSHSRYPAGPQQFAFFEELEQRVRRLPGVASVALSDSVPPGGRTMAMIFSRIAVEGRPAAPQGTGGMVVHRYVTPFYFETLGIALRSGRVFSEQDRQSKERVTVLSESLARRLFPNENPLGRRIRPGVDGPWRSIIGVVANVKNAGLLAKDDPEYYELIRNTPEDAQPAASILVRTSESPNLTGQLIQEQVGQMDRILPVKIETLTSRVSDFIARPRFNTIVLGSFALAGLLLAAVGLYGVLAFLVAQRSQELGLRMALGASQGHIAKLILWHAARWTAAGALVGIAGAMAAVKYVQTLLYEVQPRDPMTLAAVVVVLAIVAFLGAWLPSRRAARLDPMTMLRHE